MDEELKAAVAAKAAIDMQSTAPLSSATITILREAIRAATPAKMFLSERQLTEARHEVVIRLSGLIAGPPTEARIAGSHFDVKEPLSTSPCDLFRLLCALRTHFIK
jgi:precorrin-4 methylase